MAKEDKGAGEKSAENVAERRAVIFELENVAVNGRKVLFDAVAEALGACDKELTKPLFSRFCIHEPVSVFVPKLCDFIGINSKSAGKVAKHIEGSMDNFWGSKDLSFMDGFEDFLKQAHTNGLEPIALTSLTKKQSAAVMKGLDVDEGEVDVHSFAGSDSVVARADTWMQVATDRDLNPRVCIGIASSGRACKAVIAADLHCLVIPDEYTEHEDFSGARFLYDGIASVNVPELVSEFYEKE